MHKRKEPEFKLPPIRPEKKDLTAMISVQTCETSISIPRDNVRLDPALDAIMEQQRNHDLCNKLRKKRIYADTMRQKLNKQWKALYRNELTFQQTIISHNKFLKRNLEKRERAIAKMQTDQELTKKREKEIKTLNQMYDFSNSILKRMRSEIKKHSIYEDYVNFVVDLDDSPFKSDFEFINKYECLQLVKEHCVKRQTEEMATTVLYHDRNVEFFRLQDIVLIGLRNDLNNLRCKYDDIARKNLTTESLIASIVSRTNELNAEVSTCQYMIDAMYRYMCHRRKLPLVEYTLREVQPKIEILKSTLGGWEKIWNSAEIANRNKKKTREGRKSAAWKQSVSQAVLTWKKKATSEAQILQSFMQASSLFRR